MDRTGWCTIATIARARARFCGKISSIITRSRFIRARRNQIAGDVKYATVQPRFNLVA